MKVNDFLDFPVPEPQYKIPITKSAEEPSSLSENQHKQSIDCLAQPNLNGRNGGNAECRLLEIEAGKLPLRLEQNPRIEKGKSLC